jgi:hypothetical protein
MLRGRRPSRFFFRRLLAFVGIHIRQTGPDRMTWQFGLSASSIWVNQQESIQK